MTPNIKHNWFALIDCNNFYASCEAVFDPRLKNKPLGILSNNDSCIIARSQEAKDLGIPMGLLYFKNKEMLKNKGVKVLSSNYTLYGDMSARVMTILRQFTPNVEVYSIDESFIGLGGFDHKNLNNYMSELRTRVLQWTGIPVSIGIAPTKVLAKLACRVAKKNETGVYMLENQELIDGVLNKADVQDIWGIADGWGESLNSLGIYTATQLRDADPGQIKNAISVVLQRIVYELNGKSCLTLKEMPDPKENLIIARGFGQKLTELEDIEKPLSNYTRLVAEKLRKQASRCSVIQVSLETQLHNADLPRYSNTVSTQLDNPTNDTSYMTTVAKKLLSAIYKPGFDYHRCGIDVMDFSSIKAGQYNLFNQISEQKQNQSDKLMSTIDQINKKMGRDTIRLASEGTDPEIWKMRSEMRSPAYTTKISDFPKAH
jgi:DNA polymerase V